MKVDYCEQSTITEASAVLLGPPGPFESDVPIRALEFFAKDRFPLLTTEPAVVFAAHGHDVPPFWLTQMTFGPDKHRVRLGHRFLSVHFTREHGDARKYERFEESLRPQLREWCATIASSPMRDLFSVSRVGFCYVNTVDISVDANPADFFKLAIKTELKIAEHGIDAVDVRLRIGGPGQGPLHHVSLSLSSTSSGIRAISTVFVERALADTVRYGDAAVMGEVESAKNMAKEVFFDFATDVLRNKMGARYATES
jgi:hypothetical protein